MPRAARWYCYAVALIGVGFLCACVAPRVFSPWPLEWMEGASLEHARRLLHGQAIYTAPSGEFIPFMYPPLAYLPMALPSALFGPSLLAARCVMLVALLVSLLAFARAAAHVAGREAGFVTAGLYALGYGYSGGFLDVVRVDGVFMALLALGCERLAARRDSAAIVCFTLACFAKQHGVLFLLAASAFLLSSDGRKQLARVGGGALGLVAGFGALEASSHGWFSTYVVRVPQAHGLVAPLLLSFVAIDLCVYLPILCGLTIASLLRRRRQLRAADWLLLVGVIASALGRAHPGGDDNVRLPAYAMLAWCAALGFCELVTTLRNWIPLGVALFVQLVMLLQPPSLYWPSADGQRAFAQLSHELQRCADGQRSVALDHTRLTGAPFLHAMAYFDLLRYGGALEQQARQAAEIALRGEDAPHAIALSALSLPLRAVLSDRYEPCAVVDDVRLPTGYSPGRTQIFRRVR